MVKLVNSLDKTEITFLNEIEELHTSAEIPFGNADDKSEISFGKSFFSGDVAVGDFFCQFCFFFGGKQGNSAYFFEVYFDRIVYCN